MRTPWPEHGPQRKYQLVAYAVKGNRVVNHIAPDLVSYPSDDNLGHAAQKPVALYDDLLRRSIRPGDSVLDPFCGSGPIFPAAHALKCYATGIELAAASYGVSVQRIAAL
jgi:site-specific DNA-methyltransferase (adenine-specific)